MKDCRGKDGNELSNEPYWLFFAGIEGIAEATMRKLTGYFGGIRETYEASESELLASGILNADSLEHVIIGRRDYDLSGEYDDLAGRGIGFVSMEHPDYPGRLKDIPDAPFALFYRGELPSSDSPAVAIVGSRGCTPYGREMCLRFAEEFGRLGIDVISGMAAGIDGYAHRGAMNGGGRTYAVLGCGVDICYPATNMDIFERLPSQGGIISEYYPGMPPIAGNFPKRNRIISGLADGILVVEARSRSGTGITVEMGLEQGRDIYAIPGRIGDKLSDGCNRLIRQGARLVTSPEDVIAELANRYGYLVEPEANRDKRKKDKRLRGLTYDQVRVFRMLDISPKTTAQIALGTGLDFSEIMSALTILELKGIAKNTGDGRFMTEVIS